MLIIVYESWGNPEPDEKIVMYIEDYQEMKHEIEELQRQVQYHKENTEDLIEMIEEVQYFKKKIQCLYDVKDYIKKDLATGNN